MKMRTVYLGVIVICIVLIVVFFGTLWARELSVRAENKNDVAPEVTSSNPDPWWECQTLPWLPKGWTYNWVRRCVDRDANLVCYFTADGGVDCEPRPR